MLVSSILLAAVVATPAPAAPYPRPDQPGYSVVKAFVAIVQHDAEVNVQDLSYAFGLPKLLGEGGFTWRGPFGKYDQPLFSASYDPPNSALGIATILIVWDDAAIVNLGRKPGFSLGLTVRLRPNACPTEAEMVAATGVSMSKIMHSGFDGGPPYWTQRFTMPEGSGKTRTIEYSPALCELSATLMRDR